MQNTIETMKNLTFGTELEYTGIVRQIANIARIFYKQEELILNAAGTFETRLSHYTKRTDRYSSTGEVWHTTLPSTRRASFKTRFSTLIKPPFKFRI
ncbi:MAG: hypothetical protein IJW31_02405 [Lentisphaeria bacterium]|nr:hypothetical protein [Lentisphaeria bacterium]